MVQVNSEKVAKAIESAMNGVQFQSWQYFTIGEESVYCLDLIDEGEASVNDFCADNYRDYLDLCDLQDTDENYSDFVNSVLDHYKSVIVTEYNGVKIEKI